MQKANPSQSRRKRAALLLALAAFVAWQGPTKPAHADEALQPMLALIEWRHPFPAEVSYFRVHFSDTEPIGPDAGTALAVGTPGARGRYHWSFSVQPETSVWVSVEAVGPTGLESPLSEWRKYTWQAGSGALGLPGRPVLVEEAPRGPN